MQPSDDQSITNIKSILKELRDVYTIKVINESDIKITDFIADYFFPQIDRIYGMDFFSKNTDDIEDIKDIISTYRNRLSKSADDDEETRNEIKLKQKVNEKLRQLQDTVDRQSVSLGQTTDTTVKTVAEEVPLSVKQSRDYYVAPDGTYTIRNPPEDWDVRVLSMTEWISENLEVTDPIIQNTFVQNLAKEQMVEDTTKDILVYESKNKPEITPIPGQTLIHGKLFPTAMSFTHSTKLVIIPLDRYQPPLFIKRSLMHNFLNKISPYLITFTLQKMSIEPAGLSSQNKKLSLKAEFTQELSNVLINGAESSGLSLGVSVIGFEGEIKDYFVIMRYMTRLDTKDKTLESEILTMKSLVESFWPAKIIDREQKIISLEEGADEKRRTLIANRGQEMFFTEADLQFMKLSGLNLDDPTKRQIAIRRLRPFEKFAKQVGVTSEKWERFWVSLNEAERGNALEFKELFEEYKINLEKRLTPNDANYPINQVQPASLPHATANNNVTFEFVNDRIVWKINNFGIKIKTPNNWEMEQGENEVEFSPSTAGTSDDIPEAINLSFETLDPNISLQEYIDSGVKELKESDPNLVLIGNTPAVIGGIQGRKVEYAFTWKKEGSPSFGRAVYSMLICAIKANRCYAFMYSSPAEKYSGSIQIISEIVESIEFIDLGHPE